MSNEESPKSETEMNPEENKREKKALKNPKKPFNKRKFKHGSLSVALTLVFIAAVVMVNVIVWIISDRVNTSADLTAAGLYSLDEKTQSYLDESLTSDVSITVLKPEKEFEEQDASYKQVNEVLKRMEKESGHITLNYLDMDKNPNYTAKFKGETLAASYIVVECEKTGRHKIISPYDYFNFNQQYLQYYGAYMVESSNIEQEAVSAMMYTTSEELVRVAFTEGYGESESSSALKALLSKNGFETETLNLATTPEIDSGIDYVVVFAPSMDIDKEQLAKLDKFLDNGGKFGKNVVYFASTQQPETPNIDEFLSDWGLGIGYDVIGQSDENYLTSSDTLYAHLQQICDTDYTKISSASRLFTFGIHIRPVYLLDSGNSDREVLMKTYDKAFLYPLDKEKQDKFNFDTAETGEFNDAVIAQRTTDSGEKSRVLAVGSELFASSVFMSYTNSNNAEFFTDIWNYISGRQQGMTIKAKSLAAPAFEMNVKTANALSIVLCVVIPVAVITLGIVIWVRRRHR